MAFGKIPILQKRLFLREFNANETLQKYLVENDLKFVNLFAYGKSSWLVLVKNNKKKYTIKLEKNKALEKK